MEHFITHWCPLVLERYEAATPFDFGVLATSIVALGWLVSRVSSR